MAVLNVTLPDDMPEDSEQAILLLKSLGYGKIACIKALRERYGMSLADAKKQVHFSPAWEERREDDERFHAKLEKAATELGWIAKE
ncbi:MAG: ribosomal protein L7/L12 [Asticcacaulis sp.]|uniref:ribosomal protein L7/L12 n=1 Tax=Asticcacaulis sp. TaxID=1872648 RepID=UPI0039E57923